MTAEVIETLIVKELRCEKLGVAKAPDSPGQTFTITNFNEDLTLDCNGNSALVNADVLATLIQELTTLGIIGSSIS